MVSSGKSVRSLLPLLGSAGRGGMMTYHLGLILALLPDVAQHVSELGLLLIHFVQAVLGVLFLSFQLLQTACFPV